MSCRCDLFLTVTRTSRMKWPTRHELGVMLFTTETNRSNADSVNSIVKNEACFVCCIQQPSKTGNIHPSKAENMRQSLAASGDVSVMQSTCIRHFDGTLYLVNKSFMLSHSVTTAAHLALPAAQEVHIVGDHTDQHMMNSVTLFSVRVYRISQAVLVPYIVSISLSSI